MGSLRSPENRGKFKDPATASVTRLTDHPGDDVGPAWRPAR